MKPIQRNGLLVSYFHICNIYLVNFYENQKIVGQNKSLPNFCKSFIYQDSNDWLKTKPPSINWMIQV